jgi:hypothetical protein
VTSGAAIDDVDVHTITHAFEHVHERIASETLPNLSVVFPVPSTHRTFGGQCTFGAAFGRIRALVRGRIDDKDEILARHRTARGGAARCSSATHAVIKIDIRR